MKKSPLFLGMCTLGLALLAFTFYRAMALSLTHDEASTYLNHIDRSFWDCLYNPDCWKAANNHLLNTLGTATFVSIFGSAEWVVRLTNWLSHILYLVCSIALIYRTKPSLWIGLFGFCVINFHPYLLEFFGLCRGYGLCTAWVLASVAASWLYFETKKMRWVAVSWFCAILAVLSNFTTLIFFASMVAAWTVLWIWKRDIIAPENSDRMWGIMTLFTFALMSMVYTPITTLSRVGEFSWGVDSFWAGINSITTSFLMGKTYTGSDFPTILTAFLWVGVSVSVVWILYDFLKKKTHKMGQVWVTLVLVFMLFAIVSNHVLTGAKYPEGRKLIFLIPVIGLTLYFGMLKLCHKKSKYANILSAVCFVLMGAHFCNVANVDLSREWYYDAKTKVVYQTIDKDYSDSSKKVNVGIYWIFSPAMNYYQRREKEETNFNFERLQKIEPTEKYDYLYIESGHIKLVDQQYEVMERYGHGALMKRKNTSTNE